jgi:hypothetical protein
MHYALSSSLGSMSGLNTDKLALDLQFATDKTLTARRGPTPTFTRASTATFVGSNGLIQSAAINAARFDHDPVTLACKGLLIEDARTNLTVRSDDFSATEWNSISQRNLTVTANNTTSPSGATDADLLTVGATTTIYQVVQSLPATGNVTSGTAYTVSCYFKPNQVTRVSIFAGNTVTLPVDAIFDLTGAGSVVANAFGTASIQQVGNGWYRCIVTGTAGATSNTTLRFSPVSGTSRTYAGNSTDSFYAWGAQLEAGSFPTSYIPTTTASVVRSADVCSITGSSFTSFYNQSEGTLFVDGFTPASGDRTVLAVDDNTANEMMRLRTEGTNPFFKVTDGGSEVVAIDAGTVSANTTFKLAGAYKVNDFASSINGGNAVTDTSGTIPTVDRMRLGAGQGGNTMCGCISRIRYYKKRVSDTRLKSITT